MRIVASNLWIIAVVSFCAAVNIYAQEFGFQVPGSRFSELTEIIYTGNAYQRAEAIPALAAIEDPEVVPILIDLLKDTVRCVRVRAAQQLSRLADKRATPALVAALGDSCCDVRRYAAEGLARIGDDSVVPALVRSVIEQWPQLGKKGCAGTSVQAALESIATLSPEAPPEIVTLLATAEADGGVDAERWWLYEAVAKCLGRIGDKAAYEQLQKTDEILSRTYADYKTWYAVRKAMASIDPKASPFDSPAAAILYSVRVSKISDRQIYERWVLPLVRLGDSAIDEIEWSLCFREPGRGGDRQRESVAVQALGEIGGPEAARVLRDYIDGLLVDGSAAVEVSAGWRGRDLCRGCDYLFRMGLISLFKAQPDVETAKEIVDLLVLEKFQQTHVLHEIEGATPEKVPVAAAVELCRLLVLPQPPEGIDRFATWYAMKFLARLGGERAGEVLSRVLVSSRDAKLVELAAEGLGRIKGYDPVPALIEASKADRIAVTPIAKAMGTVGDARVLPALEQMAGRDDLSKAERLWVVAALARLGKDYDRNAAIVRKALPDSLEQTRWLADAETIEAVAGLSEQGRDPLELARTLEAMGTSKALERALRILSGLIDIEEPGEAEQLKEVAAAASRLAHKLGDQRESYYSDIVLVTKEVSAWFEHQQVSRARAEMMTGLQAVRRLQGLARKLWMAEVTRRLDLAAEHEEPGVDYEIPADSLRFVEEIFDPELIPVFDRLTRQSWSTVSFHGKRGRVQFYDVRSLAARILAEKTGRPYSFVDVDGRVHPGGWNPLQEN